MAYDDYDTPIRNPAYGEDRFRGQGQRDIRDFPGRATNAAQTGRYGDNSYRGAYRGDYDRYEGTPYESRFERGRYDAPEQRGGQYGSEGLRGYSRDFESPSYRGTARVDQVDRYQSPGQRYGSQDYATSDYDRELNRQLDAHDSDYAHWRSEQNRKFDEDYRAFREERRKQFHSDFETYRSQREQTLAEQAGDMIEDDS